MTSSNWNFGNVYAIFQSELSPLIFPLLDNTLPGWINIDIWCYIVQYYLFNNKEDNKA